MEPPHCVSSPGGACKTPTTTTPAASSPPLARPAEGDSHRQSQSHAAWTPSPNPTGSRAPHGIQAVPHSLPARVGRDVGLSPIRAPCSAQPLRGRVRRRDAPMSPTDILMSPVSRQLARRQPKRVRRTAGLTHPGRVPVIPKAVPRLVLGSSSSGRRQVMEELGIPFSVMKPGIDEKAVRHADPKQLPVVVALAKAKALLPRVGADCTHIITADQVVLIDGTVCEKPESVTEARSFISRFPTARVESVSAVVVTNVKTRKMHSGIDCVVVSFDSIPDKDIEAAIDGGAGDVMWCSGALCVEHTAMAPHIQSMSGPIDSVFGLPKTLLLRLLREGGYVVSEDEKK